MDVSKQCCPQFSPEKWDNKIFNWYDKPFIKESMITFFHLPFPWILKSRITKLCQFADSCNSSENVKTDDVLLLFRDPSAFKSEIYLSVDKEIAKALNVKITGDFMAKVFSGPYKDVPKFIKLMDEYLSKEGKKAKDYYIHYAYCPKCAEKYGNNYMIIFTQL
jgi:hypothetical protein